MLKAIFKKLSANTDSVDRHTLGHSEQQQLHAAVAGLLHEAARVDLAQSPNEFAAAKQALIDLFHLQPDECQLLVDDARQSAPQLTSYFSPVSIIKRQLDVAERIALLEHLWRVTYADAQLDIYEDHFVRKIAHLLHVPNTQTIIARNSARSYWRERIHKS